MGFANPNESRLPSQGDASPGGFAPLPLNPNELTEIRCQWSCRIASVRFVGIQPSYGIRPDLLLCAPLSGLLKHSTLAVELRSASPLAIASRLSQAIGAGR